MGFYRILGYCSNFRSFPRRIRWGSQHSIFLLGFMDLPISTACIYQRREGQRGTANNIKYNRVLFSKIKTSLWFMVMVLMISIPHRMNDALLGLYLNKLGATDSMVSWAWAIAACTEIPVFASYQSVHTSLSRTDHLRPRFGLIYDTLAPLHVIQRSLVYLLVCRRHICSPLLFCGSSLYSMSYVCAEEVDRKKKHLGSMFASGC